MDNFNNKRAGFTQPFQSGAQQEAERAGFTLLELMVVVAIFTIVIGASYALLSSGRTGWYIGDAKIELQENLRQAMDAMVSELSESVFTKVIIGQGGGSVTFQTPVQAGNNGSWEDTDSDKKPDFYLKDTWDSVKKRVRWGAYLRGEDYTAGITVPSTGGVGWVVLREGRWVSFLLQGDKLIRRVLRGALDSSRTVIMEDFSLADNIQGLSFVRISNDVIEINITARKLTIERHPVIYSLSTEVHLRSNV